MKVILRQLQDQFPVLARLLLQERGGSSTPQALPPYLGIFLAVLEKAPTPPVCFVLPRRGDVARLAAALYAMHQLTCKQEQLTRSYAGRSFNIGDLVCVHPSREVFRYGGYDATRPDRIWLETIDSSGKWQVRAADVVNRLERTTRIRPIGRLNSPILSPPAAALDLLLGTSFFGNHSLFENELLILDSVSGFEIFADRCGFLAGAQPNGAPSLNTLLPLGRIAPPDPAHPGWLRKWDQNGGAGEPTIAVTHSDELLANLCIDASPRSKLVVVNGLEHIRSIQAYDDISQTQRLIAFTDRHDEEMIETLGKRGCRFWPLGGRELVSWANVDTSRGMLGSVKRWAENYNALLVDDMLCEDPHLDEIWFKLDKLRATTDRANDDSTITRLASRVWWLFLNATGAWEIPTADERSNVLGAIDAFRQEVGQHRAWLAPESVRLLTEIAESLAGCYTPDSALGSTKRATLLGAVRQATQENCRLAILVRNEAKVGELRRWLSGHNLATHAEAFSPTTLPSSEPFDRVICVSWPGGEPMKQVVSKLAAPRVTVIGYRCERHWLRQCQPRFKKNIPAQMLTGDEKSALVCGENQTRAKWPEEETQAPSSAVPVVGSDIWEFERRLRIGRIGLAARPTDAAETLPARYVRFSGDCYAFLTESHKLPVATRLVSAEARPNQALPERALLDIGPGDFVVFPESGERELIQELADKLVGQAAEQLRRVAHFWKDALHSSGLTPEEFRKHADELKRPRHPITIRNWFAYDSQIGPREKDDLVLIAIVTKDERLERELDSVWSAIEQLRSAHLSAGMRLRDALLRRLPQVIGQVEENGTKVDLGELGSAWIVRVESIETEAEPRGRGEVNRLLFDKFIPDVSDLLRGLV